MAAWLRGETFPEYFGRREIFLGAVATMTRLGFMVHTAYRVDEGTA